MRGEALEILAQTTDGDWFLVRFQDGRTYGLGWVWSPMLALGGDAAEAGTVRIGVAATVPPTPTR